MSGGQLSAMQTADYRVVPLPREINMTAAAEGFKLLPTTKIAYSKGDEQQKRMLNCWRNISADSPA